MNASRVVKIQNELQSRTLDLVSQVKCFHGTHASLIDRQIKLYDRYPNRLPHHVKAYIRGYFTALIDSLYHTDLVHGYEWNGRVYTNWDTFPEDLKKVTIDDVDDIPHGHWWKDTVVTGENRPFFLGKMKG